MEEKPNDAADPRSRLTPLPGSFVTLPEGQAPFDGALRDKPAALRKFIRDSAAKAARGEALTAADLNNLGCAHAWIPKPNDEHALESLQQALGLSPSAAERRVIRRNTEIVEKYVAVAIPLGLEAFTVRPGPGKRTITANVKAVKPAAKTKAMLAKRGASTSKAVGKRVTGMSKSSKPRA